jgi:hypothetical protein
MRRNEQNQVPRIAKSDYNGHCLPWIHTNLLQAIHDHMRPLVEIYIINIQTQTTEIPKWNNKKLNHLPSLFRLSLMFFKAFDAHYEANSTSLQCARPPQSSWPPMWLKPVKSSTTWLHGPMKINEMKAKAASKIETNTSFHAAWCMRWWKVFFKYWQRRSNIQRNTTMTRPLLRLLQPNTKI